MVYLCLAEGFEEIEALAPLDLLRRAGLPVQTVGVTGAEVTGSHGIFVRCDIAQNEMDFRKMQMLVLPGGMPGTTNLEASQTVKNAVAFAVQNEIPIGAICAAPTILGHLGYLDQKPFTCYPGFEAEIPNGIYTGENLVVCGQIITAKAAGSALDFGLALIEKQLGAQAAADVRAAVYY